MKINGKQFDLIIELEGTQKLWGLRRKLIIPKENISKIEWFDLFEDFGNIRRLYGTAAPGLLYAGLFKNNGNRNFLYVKKPHKLVRPYANNILLIETNGFKYSRVILTTDKTTATEIISWWHGKVPSSVIF